MPGHLWRTPAHARAIGYRIRMTRRRPLRPLTACALALAASTLFGCSPEPAPTPSPSPAFASEEEAFAAAEETYRAYIDALNEVDFSDPSTFTPVLALLTDSAASSTKKTFSEFHAEGLRMTGTTAFDSFEGIAAESELGSVSTVLCLDVTAVVLTSNAGESLVSPDRLDRQPMRVELQTQPTDGELRISSMRAEEGYECAR